MTTKPTTRQVTHDGQLLHTILTNLTADTIVSGGDVVSALGYVPAAAASPALTGTPTAPTAIPGTNNTQIATTAFVTSATAGAGSAAALSSDLANAANPSKGASLVGHRGRTLKDRADDQMSLTDFGAVGNDHVGDTTTNDTAIAAALAYISSTGKSVFIPPGVYYCNPFIVHSEGYSTQGGFFGNDRERTILRRASAGSGPFVQFGNFGSGVFHAGLQLRGLTFDGGVAQFGNTAITLVDVVRSSITDCSFRGGSVACHMYGGISTHFTNCLFHQAETGLKLEAFGSSAGGGFPNSISVTGGEIVDNTLWGVHFTGGRLLTLRSVDIEGNGIGLAGGGGVFVSDVGAEVADGLAAGVVATECWFEANNGSADFYATSGTNSVRDCLFFSPLTTYNLRFDAGTYSVQGVTCHHVKAQNLLEGVGTTAGNSIVSSRIPNLSHAPAKTSVLAASLSLKNGTALATPQANSLLQTGYDTTASDTFIYFPAAYSAPPAVFLQAIGGITPTIAHCPKVVYVDSYKFKISKLIVTGGTVSDSAYDVIWSSVGSQA